jgi:hypothetical protein
MSGCNFMVDRMGRHHNDVEIRLNCLLDRLTPRELLTDPERQPALPYVLSTSRRVRELGSGMTNCSATSSISATLSLPAKMCAGEKMSVNGSTFIELLAAFRGCFTA